MSLRNFAILLILGLIWGASFLFIKVAVVTIPPLSVAFGRTALAGVLLYLVLRSQGLRMPGWSPVWGTFLLMGFTGDERLTWTKVVGIVLGFLGVLTLIGPAALKGLGKDVVAQLAVMAAALCYAIAIIYGRRLKEVTPLVSATGQLFCAAFLTLPMSLVFDTPWALAPSFISLGALTCLSLLGTALAYLLYYYLLPRIGSTNLSLVTYLIPITGVFWGTLLLGERLHWSAFLALGLILAGISGVNNRLPKLRFAKKMSVETTAK
jgi:drug/metabolite transporter (DMT)-like permease